MKSECVCYGVEHRHLFFHVYFLCGGLNWCLFLPVMSELEVNFPSRLTSHFLFLWLPAAPWLVSPASCFLAFHVYFSLLAFLSPSMSFLLAWHPGFGALASVIVRFNKSFYCCCLLRLHLGPKLMVPGSVHGSKPLQLTYSEEVCQDKI